MGPLGLRIEVFFRYSFTKTTEMNISVFLNFIVFIESFYNVIFNLHTI